MTRVVIHFAQPGRSASCGASTSRSSRVNFVRLGDSERVTCPECLEIRRNHQRLDAATGQARIDT